MAQIKMGRKVSDSVTLGETVRIWEVFDSMGIVPLHYDRTPITAEEFVKLVERIKALNLVENVQL